VIVFDRLFMVFDCCSWCFYYFDTWLRLVVLRSYVKVSGLVVFVFMFLWFVCCLVCVMRVECFFCVACFVSGLGGVGHALCFERAHEA